MFKFLTKTYLDSIGWTVRNDVPDDVDKFVIIAAPHTSNWDFPITMAIARQIDMKFYWVGKHTLFEPAPVGAFMKSLGGIPIDRRKSQNFVEQIAEAFDQADAMALGIAPEGTRSKREFWKSGFYYIAREAGVPISLGFLDYGKKIGGLGPLIDSSQPKKVVMDKIRDFSEGIEGQKPENYTRPRLRNEEEDPEESQDAEDVQEDTEREAAVQTG